MSLTEMALDLNIPTVEQLPQHQHRQEQQEEQRLQELQLTLAEMEKPQFNVAETTHTEGPSTRVDSSAVRPATTLT